jgi:stage II sporulation protein D
VICEGGARPLKDPIPARIPAPDIPPTITLRYTAKGTLLVQEPRLSTPFKAVVFEPYQGSFIYEGTRYHGSLRIYVTDTQLYLINIVDLDDYLTSVVRWESWPGWPKEVHKAFAIMCRTYVVHKIAQSRRKNRVYDVTATNVHQTYKGICEVPVYREAVKETEGIVLTHNGTCIDAMFDSCCGGILPEHLDEVDIRRHPYFKRPRCTFCKKCGLYEWHVSYTTAEFQQALSAHMGKKVTIKSVRITDRDTAGAVKTIECMPLKGGKPYIVTGKEFGRICKKIKSKAYDLSWSRQAGLSIAGKGFGHHIGLCQWGAYFAHKDHGWDYKKILEFYYPQTKLMVVS